MLDDDDGDDIPSSGVVAQRAPTAETEPALLAVVRTPPLGVPAIPPAVASTLVARIAAPPVEPIVEAVVDTSAALTRPTELVPTAAEIAVMALADAAPEAQQPAPVPEPKTIPPRPPPGAPLMVVRIPPKPERAQAVAFAPPATGPRRSRLVIASAALAFAGLLVAIGSVLWARGEVERARQAATPAPEPTPLHAPPAPARDATPVATTAAPASDAEPAAAPQAKRPRREPRKHHDRPQSEVTVRSSPPGVDVFVAGRRIGKTPLVTKVTRDRETTLWFRAPGMAADWRRILPRTATSAVHVTMQPAAVVAR